MVISEAIYNIENILNENKDKLQPNQMIALDCAIDALLFKEETNKLRATVNSEIIDRFFKYLVRNLDKAKHGWIETDEEGIVKCPVCGRKTYWDKHSGDNYCKKCGARMDKIDKIESHYRKIMRNIKQQQE